MRHELDCPKFSDIMKERFLRVRLADLRYKFLILTKWDVSATAEALKSYEQTARRCINNDIKFRRWCKEAFGFYPEQILEGREEKSEKEITDFINKKIDEAVEKMRKAGLDVTVI